MVHPLSCSIAYGIFLDQGSNLCPMHWQEDFYPLCHQPSGSWQLWEDDIWEKCSSEMGKQNELNVLNANNFYNNSSYHLLNVGCVPVTLFNASYGFCQVILIKTL